MSKVSLQGNISGSGTLTIAAPNTNSNYTLTLPAESGTLITSGGAIDVSASAPADSLVLDSSGNLGLGVTPSGWSGYKAIDVGSNAVMSGSTSAALANNGYYGGGSNWTYKNSSFAGLYQIQNDGKHVWSLAPSGTAGNAITFTQAMTLAANGNLGITGSSFDINPASGNPNITLREGNTFRGYIEANSAGLLFGTGAAATERARIDSSGNLLVGTTSGSRKFNVETTENTGSEIAYFSHNAATTANQYGVVFRLVGDPNGTGNSFLNCLGNVTQRAAIRSNGGIANYQANDVNLSDRREKTNFAPAEDYLSKICAIPVQTFNYADQNLEEDPGLTLGVVAQDVQAVAPELVMESNWGTEEEPKMRLSIYQTDLQYALMKCIQELSAKNDELTARIAALESK